MWGALAVLAGVAAWQGRSYLAGTEAPGEPGTVAAGSAGATDGSGPRGNLGIPSRPGNDPQERPGATWDLEDDPIPATIARSLDARRARARERAAAAAARLANPPGDQAAPAGLHRHSKSRLEVLRHDLERPGAEPIVLTQDEPRATPPPSAE